MCLVAPACRVLGPRGGSFSRLAVSEPCGVRWHQFPPSHKCNSYEVQASLRVVLRLPSRSSTHSGQFPAQQPFTQLPSTAGTRNACQLVRHDEKPPRHLLCNPLTFSRLIPDIQPVHSIICVHHRAIPRCRAANHPLSCQGRALELGSPALGLLSRLSPHRSRRTGPLVGQNTCSSPAKTRAIECTPSLNGHYPLSTPLAGCALDPAFLTWLACGNCPTHRLGALIAAVKDG